jgi:hypothetical protein
MKIQYSATLLSIMIASSSCTLFPGSANEPNDPNSPNDSGSTSSAIVQVDSTGSNTGTDTGTNTSTTSSAFVANTAVAASTATQTAMSESTDGGLPTVVVVTVVVTVNLEDAGVSVALAPNADPPADPDAGTVDPTPDAGAVLPEASTPVADSGMADLNSPETSTVIFAQTIPDAGTEASTTNTTLGSFCCPDSSTNCSQVPANLITVCGSGQQCLTESGLVISISPGESNGPFTCQQYQTDGLVGSICNTCDVPFDCNGSRPYSAGLLESCGSGLQCLATAPGSFITATCQPRPGLGGICNTPLSTTSQIAECAPGLICFGIAIYNIAGGATTGTSTCITPLPVGASCLVDNDCAQTIQGFGILSDVCNHGDAGCPLNVENNQTGCPGTCQAF